MGESKLNFFVVDIIMLIVFLSLINMVFNLKRLFFVFEVIVLLVIGFFTIISMIAVYNNARWGWTFLSYIFGIILLNMLFIYYIAGRPDFFFISAITALVGLLVSAINIKTKKKEEKEVVAGAKKKAEAKATKEFKPGKYVASKTGTKYHAPKCDWAKKIKKSNQVWFNNEGEAKKKGYKADACIKSKVYRNF
jgi:hypothetical protein